MFARLLSVSALTVAALAASGCGRSVAIGTWVPPEADIGGARRLVVTDAYGRGSSVAAITDFALDEADAAAWFDVVDLSIDRLESDGRSAWLGNRGKDLDGGTLYVRLDVLEDSAVANEHVAVDDATGEEVVVVEESLVAHTLVAMTVADRRGVIVLEREVEGVHEQAGPISDADIAAAMEAAGRAAVHGALVLITPTSVTVQVPLDDRDQPAFDAAVDGLEGDRDDRRAAIAVLQKQDSAAALYNAGVLAEDNGDVEAAVDLYDDACDRGDAADFCDDVLVGAEQRLANERALGLR